MNLEQIMAEIVKDSVGNLLDFKQDTADLRMVGRSIRDGVLGGLIRGLQEHGEAEYLADIEIDIDPADITSLLSNRALGDNSQKPEESEETSLTPTDAGKVPARVSKARRKKTPARKAAVKKKK